MQGAGRPTSARLFDRKRRQGNRGRANHGTRSRAGASTLVSWGVRNGLKLWGGTFLLFVGLSFILQVFFVVFLERGP